MEKKSRVSSWLFLFMNGGVQYRPNFTRILLKRFPEILITLKNLSYLSLYHLALKSGLQIDCKGQGSGCFRSRDHKTAKRQPLQLPVCSECCPAKSWQQRKKEIDKQKLLYSSETRCWLEGQDMERIRLCHSALCATYARSKPLCHLIVLGLGVHGLGQ